MLSGTILRKKGLIWMALRAAMLLAPATASYADTYPVGYVSYDVTGTGVAQFDITNLTGPNSSGDATFPVTTSLSFTDLSLDVSFASGPDEVFTGSYFTLNSDGLSWDGTALSTLSGQPSGLAGAISATLTGTFGTTYLTLYDGSSIMVDPSFTATITDVAGLTDGDLAIIDVSLVANPMVISLWLIMAIIECNCSMHLDDFFTSLALKATKMINSIILVM